MFCPAVGGFARTSHVMSHSLTATRSTPKGAHTAPNQLQSHNNPSSSSAGGPEELAQLLWRRPQGCRGVALLQQHLQVLIPVCGKDTTRSATQHTYRHTQRQGQFFYQAHASTARNTLPCHPFPPNQTRTRPHPTPHHHTHLASSCVLSVPHTMLNSGPWPRCLCTLPAIASSFLSTPSIVLRIRLRTCLVCAQRRVYMQKQ